MKILVTGDTGYVGTLLSKKLIESNYSLVGLDLDLFLENDLIDFNRNYYRIKKDICNINENDLKDVDIIMHLAGLSNDPIGELNENLTDKINFTGTVKLAKLAKTVGVKKFLYASTQSVYGISENIDIEIKENTKNIRPITAYAKSKYKAENEILKLSDKTFHTIIFRPATVFGPSINFRSDIVLNNLVASAHLYKKIIIQSDGTPWRPILHIDDMCNFFIKSLNKSEKLNKEIINLGYPKYNFQVKDLAEKVKKIIPDAEIIIENKKIDNRTYKVNFDKVFKFFKDDIEFNLNIEQKIKELLDFYKKVNFDRDLFEGRKTIRMKQLKYLIDNKNVFKN